MTDNSQSGRAGPWGSVEPWNYLQIWAFSCRDSFHLIVYGLCDPIWFKKPAVLWIWLKRACSTVQKWHSRVLFVLLTATSWVSAPPLPTGSASAGTELTCIIHEAFHTCQHVFKPAQTLYPPPLLVSWQNAAQSVPDMLITSDSKLVDVELDRGLQYIYWLCSTIFYLFS